MRPQALRCGRQEIDLAQQLIEALVPAQSAEYWINLDVDETRVVLPPRSLQPFESRVTVAARDVDLCDLHGC